MSTKHTASSRISSWDLLVELDNLLCLWCLAEKASGCGCSSHFWNLNWDNHLVHSGKHYIVIYYDIITVCTCVVYVSICGGMSIFWSTCMCMHPNDYCILLSKIYMIHRSANPYRSNSPIVYSLPCYDDTWDLLATYSIDSSYLSWVGSVCKWVKPILLELISVSLSCSISRPSAGSRW